MVFALAGILAWALWETSAERVEYREMTGQLLEVKGKDDPDKKAFLVGRIQLPDGKEIKLILPPQQPHPKVGDRVPLIYERYDDGQVYYFFNTLTWVSNGGMP
ncbi:MAG: hypothetical protein QNL62_06900 [Gammaproteobacteria bacterium]|nr:hypothetical protein [Gammaproteobacteria bacterium]